jgi:pimeloyl-ACP methyl ester carboxylesterase
MESVDNSVHRGYANTPAGQIHYAESGSGIPLLMLSATPRTHRSFLPLMALLSPYCRALAVDILAKCIIDFLNALEIPRINLFGLHTGNKLAAAMAARFPERVEKLILAGQSHSIVPEIDIRNESLQPWFKKYRTDFEPHADGTHLVREWLGSLINLQEIWWPAKLVAGRSVNAIDIKNAEARAIDFALGWRSCVPVYEAIFAFDLESAYRAITHSTLVIELMTKREAHIGGQGPRVCELIDNATSAQLIEMDGLGLEMRPEQFARLILPFLGYDGATRTVSPSR